MCSRVFDIYARQKIRRLDKGSYYSSALLAVKGLFQNIATSPWNELQPGLKLSPTVTNFKRLLSRKLLNEFTLSLSCVKLSSFLNYVMYTNIDWEKPREDEPISLHVCYYDLFN